MHRSLTFLALAAAVVPASALPASAGCPAPRALFTCQQSSPFQELLPTAVELEASEAPLELLGDALARIGVERELRSDPVRAMAAERVLLKQFLQDGCDVPSEIATQAVQLFLERHAVTRRQAGEPELDVKTPEGLAQLADIAGVPDASVLVPRAEPEAAVSPTIPAPTSDEIQSYLQAHYPPVSDSIRELVFQSIKQGEERIRALGLRAAGPLAELVLVDLDNPFGSLSVGSPITNTSTIPAVDPLILLSSIDPKAAVQLVNDHLDRGGVGWATRIETLFGDRGVPEGGTPADAERWFVRIMREPLLHSALAPNVEAYFRRLHQWPGFPPDLGVATAAILELDDPLILGSSALRWASHQTGLNPAIAELARVISSDPGASVGRAIDVASQYPGCEWILEFADDPDAGVRGRVLLALGQTEVLAKTTIGQRTRLLEAEVGREPAVSPAGWVWLIEEGHVTLTPELVAAIAALEDYELRKVLGTEAVPSDPQAVVGALLEQLKLNPQGTFGSSITGSDWIQAALQEPAGLAATSEYLRGADEREFSKLRTLLTADLCSTVLFRALDPLDRSDLKLANLEVFEPSPDLPAEILENLFDIATRATSEEAYTVREALTAPEREEVWNARAVASDPARPALARTLALETVLGQLNTTTQTDRALTKQVLSSPDLDQLLVLAESNPLRSLAAILAETSSSNFGDTEHPLVDAELTAALSVASIDELTECWSNYLPPRLSRALLVRLAADLPLSPRTVRKVFEGLTRTQLDAPDVDHLLAYIDRVPDSLPALGILSLQADPQHLQRFQALLDHVSGSGKEIRNLAIHGLGRIGTVEAADVLRTALREHRLDVELAATARTQLDLIRERIEQDRYWSSLDSGLPARDEALAQLAAQLESGTSATRAAAAKALGAMGAVTLQPTLIGLLEDPDAAVRSAAAEALDLIALQVRRDLEREE